MIYIFTFLYRLLLCVHFLSLICYLGTCISVVGLGMVSRMYITPNKGSGAPSASSRRDRASGKSRVCLRDNKRPRNKGQRVIYCLRMQASMWNEEHLDSPAVVIYINFLGGLLFHQLANNGLKFLCKDTKAQMLDNTEEQCTCLSKSLSPLTC